MNLVCTKHLIISLQIASSPIALPFFKSLEALMITVLLIPLSSLSLDVVKSFALLIILPHPQGVDCGLFSFLNHSYHSKGSMLSVRFSSLCVFSFFTISQNVLGSLLSSWLILCNMVSRKEWSLYLTKRL